MQRLIKNVYRPFKQFEASNTGPACGWYPKSKHTSECSQAAFKSLQIGPCHKGRQFEKPYGDVEGNLIDSWVWEKEPTASERAPSNSSAGFEGCSDAKAHEKAHAASDAAGNIHY